MPAKDCPNCGSRVDMTKDGLYGHCASCNNILDFSAEQQGEEKKDDTAATGDRQKDEAQGKGEEKK